MSRATAQQISFADWELIRRGICLEPLLQAISNFLDDQQKIVEQVRRDLARGLKNPKSGRRGLTPQQVLRALILKRVKNWDYRELRERIADGPAGTSGLTGIEKVRCLRGLCVAG